MPEKHRDPSIVALEAVYAALKELSPQDRQKVLSSAFALLDLEGAAIHRVAAIKSNPDDRYPSSLPSRPISLVELINEKNAKTNPQYIALFAYYREKVEGFSRFSRDDLKPYFAKAKLQPAANYDRDFVEAVKRGWIHEDGSESYLTTRGVEAVESSFEGERAGQGKVRKKTGKKKRGSRKKRKS